MNFYAYLLPRLNAATFLAGCLCGALGILAVQALLHFLLNHWKPIVILCGVSVATAAVIMALRGGF